MHGGVTHECTNDDASHGYMDLGFTSSNLRRGNFFNKENRPHGSQTSRYPIPMKRYKALFLGNKVADTSLTLSKSQPIPPSNNNHLIKESFEYKPHNLSNLIKPPCMNRKAHEKQHHQSRNINKVKKGKRDYSLLSFVSREHKKELAPHQCSYI